MTAALKPERNVARLAAPPCGGCTVPTPSGNEALPSPSPTTSSSRSSSATFRFFINSFPSSLKKVPDASSSFAADGSSNDRILLTNSLRADALSSISGSNAFTSSSVCLCAGSENSFFIVSSFSSTALRDSLCAAVSPAEPSALPGALEAATSSSNSFEGQITPTIAKLRPGRSFGWATATKFSKNCPVKLPGGVRDYYSIRAT